MMSSSAWMELSEAENWSNVAWMLVSSSVTSLPPRASASGDGVRHGGERGFLEIGEEEFDELHRVGVDGGDEHAFERFGSVKLLVAHGFVELLHLGEHVVGDAPAGCDVPLCGRIALLQRLVAGGHDVGGGGGGCVVGARGERDDGPRPVDGRGSAPGSMPDVLRFGEFEEFSDFRAIEGFVPFGIHATNSSTLVGRSGGSCTPRPLVLQT